MSILASETMINIYLSLLGDGMTNCAASWTEDLMVGGSIPAVAQGYLIFPAQKYERHQEQLHSSGVVR